MKELKPQGAKMQATGNAHPAKPTGLTTEIQARIGHQLRAMYDEVVKQGVPDRFAELVRKLDNPGATPGASEASGANSKPEGSV